MTRSRTIAAVAVLASLMSACGAGGTGTGDATPDRVVLLAYDAFTPAEGAFDSFTAATGAQVEVVTGGDSGTVVNKAILTAGNPEADVLWGVDDTMLSRAREADLLESYEPVDTGDVCINYSKQWYARRDLVPPSSRCSPLSCRRAAPAARAPVMRPPIGSCCSPMTRSPPPRAPSIRSPPPPAHRWRW